MFQSAFVNFSLVLLGGSLQQLNFYKSYKRSVKFLTRGFKLILSISTSQKPLIELVDHRLMVNKLKNFGISGTLLNWFEDYLSNRHQRVTWQDLSSTPHTVWHTTAFNTWTFVVSSLCELTLLKQHLHLLLQCTLMILNVIVQSER